MFRVGDRKRMRRFRAMRSETEGAAKLSHSALQVGPQPRKEQQATHLRSEVWVLLFLQRGFVHDPVF